ncbi:hypothetical protein HJFPF1_13546 [Paramyrothecium foliicola]|nr:hypothetical protein HJFPF1_13546 [Paramyrothecium foliicola]
MAAPTGISTKYIWTQLALQHAKKPGSDKTEAIGSIIRSIHKDKYDAKEFAATDARGIPTIPKALCPEFLGWSKESKSSLFLASATSKPVGTFTSQLTGLCGHTAIHMKGRAFCACAFFCGMHATGSETPRGGKDLLREVLFQLLHLVPERPLQEHLYHDNYVQELNRGDLKSLMDTFDIFLNITLPKLKVYVFVDGVDAYDMPPWRFEVDAVMRFLCDRVKEHIDGKRNGPSLKLFVSNPTPRQLTAWGIPTQTVTRIQDFRDDESEHLMPILTALPLIVD